MGHLMEFLGHIPSAVVPADLSFNGVIAAAAAAAWNRFFPLIGVLLATAAKCFWYFLQSHLFRWDIILSLMTVGAESISAALEQASPHELKIALYGLLMAAVSLVLCFAELAYKLYEHCKTARNSGTGRPRQWEWDLFYGFGLLCSFLTLMSAVLNYYYLSSGKQQPIRVSVLPLAFSVCVLCSRIFKRPTSGGTLQVFCSVCQAQAKAQQREPIEQREGKRATERRHKRMVELPLQVKPTATELHWIDRSLNSIPSFKKRPETDSTVADAPAGAENFSRLRGQVLRELGFRGIFQKVKDEENAKAISLFWDVVRINDAIEDEPKRLENLVRGIFAGNIFNLGSAQLAEVFSRDGMSFLACCQSLVPRPWVIDDLDTFKVKWSKKSWKKAVIFVDKSGADIILGILPFARELLKHGTQVVLAANGLPSINDVTYDELVDIISKLADESGQLMGVDTSNLLIANAGNDLPAIDLTGVSQDLAYLATDADLVILEGMGRGIETNLYAQFKCDFLKIGMVKHTKVAKFLGGRLYDCVFKYKEVLN